MAFVMWSSTWTALRQETGLAFTYGQMGVYKFEVCGEDGDTVYHHHPNTDTAPVQAAILKSGEKTSDSRLLLMEMLCTNL